MPLLSELGGQSSGVVSMQHMRNWQARNWKQSMATPRALWYFWIVYVQVDMWIQERLYKTFVCLSITLIGQGQHGSKYNFHYMTWPYSITSAMHLFSHHWFFFFGRLVFLDDVVMWYHPVLTVHHILMMYIFTWVMCKFVSFLVD